MRRHTSVRSVPIVSPRVQASGMAPAASSPMRCGVTRFVDREGLFDTERMERGNVTAVRPVLEWPTTRRARAEHEAPLRRRRAAPASAVREPEQANGSDDHTLVIRRS